MSFILFRYCTSTTIIEIPEDDERDDELLALLRLEGFSFEAVCSFSGDEDELEDFLSFLTGESFLSLDGEL